MDATRNQSIENLIFVTARLIEIMTTEIELLKNMRPDAIRELQKEKANLARTYEDLMGEIKAAPELLAGAARPLKRQLQELTTTFRTVLGENERALRAVKSVSERLLSVIVNSVAEKQSGAAYSASGAMGTSALAANKGVSLALNQRL